MSEWWCDEANVRAVKDLATSRGLMVRSSRDKGEERCQMVSVSIVPSMFPKELYELACTVQKDFNTLIEAVSRDHEFLTTALKNVIRTDDFTLQVFKIYEAVRFDDEQTCRLGLHRCDYMVGLGTGDVELASLGLRQVEINTISVSTLGLFSSLGDFHHYVHSRYYPTDPLQIPPNPCLQSIVTGLSSAWEEYGKPSAQVLMVVQENERNIFDQRAVEFELWKRHKVPMMRKTLKDLTCEATLGTSRELIVSGEEIAVVYYRAGYTPQDYPTEKEWAVRLLMELSKATLCPCAAYHLVGTKRVQQVLAAPGVLERYLTDDQAVQRVRSTFAGLYGLDMGPEGDSAVQMALEKPEGFVLKPQREGGGNNFFGEDLKRELSRVASSPERESYIVMEKITPPPQLGLIAKAGTDKVELTPVVGELGILGVYLRKQDKVILDFEGGHNLRTKPISMNEGGVAVGISCLDSPNLVPAKEFVQCINRS